MFRKIWDWLTNLFGGGGDTGMGAELVIKLIALEVFKGNPGLADKLVRIIADILKAVNNKTVTDFSGIQSLIDKALINVTLLPEESLALGILISRIKAKFNTEMVDKAFTAGKDFTVAVQYLTWVQAEAEAFSTKV